MLPAGCSDIRSTPGGPRHQERHNPRARQRVRSVLPGAAQARRMRSAWPVPAVECPLEVAMLKPVHAHAGDLAERVDRYEEREPGPKLILDVDRRGVYNAGHELAQLLRVLYLAARTADAAGEQ